MEQKNLSYGLSGLAGIIGCSKATAWRIKSSGVIDAAIIQIGRKIIIDNNKLFECLKKNINTSNRED